MIAGIAWSSTSGRTSSELEMRVSTRKGSTSMTDVRGATGMSPRPGIGHGALLLAAVLALSSGCGKTAQSQIEGETHWLSRCSARLPCPESFECHCDVCTRRCEAPSSCEDIAPGAVCRLGSETSHRCDSAEQEVSICIQGPPVEPRTDAGDGDPVSQPMPFPVALGIRHGSR